MCNFHCAKIVKKRLLAKYKKSPLPHVMKAAVKELFFTIKNYFLATLV